MSVIVKVKNNITKDPRIGANFELSVMFPTWATTSTTALGAIPDIPSLIVGVPDVLDSMTQLQPGAEVTGSIYFEVPTAAVTKNDLMDMTGLVQPGIEQKKAGVVLLAEPPFTLDTPAAEVRQRFLSLIP